MKKIDVYEKRIEELQKSMEDIEEMLRSGSVLKTAGEIVEGHPQISMQAAELIAYREICQKVIRKCEFDKEGKFEEWQD